MPPKLREEALALLMEERHGVGAAGGGGGGGGPVAHTHMKALLPSRRVRARVVSLILFTWPDLT